VVVAAVNGVEPGHGLDQPRLALCLLHQAHALFLEGRPVEDPCGDEDRSRGDTGHNKDKPGEPAAIVQSLGTEEARQRRFPKWLQMHIESVRSRCSDKTFPHC
jgi:hypothetical protein